MAIANMTRDMIFLQTRRLLGVTDATKGGPADADLYDDLNGTIGRFCFEAGALETVIKLATTANDKYLPLVNEILWVKTCSFLDVDGRSYELSLLEHAPRPGSIGARPSNYWLTAVNVPDATGKSVRTLGIDPAANWAPTPGNYNVILEAWQLPQDLSGATDYAEIHPAVQRYIPFAFALDLLPIFPEKLNLEGYLERQRARGIDAFRKLARSGAKRPFGGKDVMDYKRRARSRL